MAERARPPLRLVDELGPTEKAFARWLLERALQRWADEHGVELDAGDQYPLEEEARDDA